MADNLLIDPDKLVRNCLSNREYEVLCKIAEGKNMKLIAEELFISEKTVRTDRPSAGASFRNFTKNY